MKNYLQKLFTISLLLLGSFAFANTYEIYPRPQKISYTADSFPISNSVNIIIEKKVDTYTKNRIIEILNSHKIKFRFSNQIQQNLSNILLGVNNSNEIVDKYFNQNVPHQENFFNKTDAHIVYVKNQIIAVLGNNTDSTFYGVTTLKHIFNQISNNSIRALRIDDFSNVKHRGFIEGYYGNPWSNEDRAQLMIFGGDYKLNTYFFAPKDDLYHNSKWRELYPEKELAEIRKLAEVGNATKNKYVYALHCFMHHAFRFDNEANYQADLKIVKEKFTQLLENSVRAFSILADDASVPPQGPQTYVKLLNDLTNFLIAQKKAKYPDIVTDIPFCPNDYMGWGNSTQLREVNKAPNSVSIVMTGGRIWGEVSHDFTSKFIQNIASENHPGRPAYLWINWPCSDNSKQHLIMGGNDTFLHPNVTPENIQGIILNPMQQAEANKSALFAIADYAWNIWQNSDQANKNWHDSFKYMDHGSAKETKASTALREICQHMINQNMDGRVRALQESVTIAPILKNFLEKANSNSLKKGDTAELIKIFQNLKNAANYYKNNPGNPRTRDQIIHWLNCYEDTTTAAINLLKCTEALLNNDNEKTWQFYSSAQMAFEKSKTYKFRYVNHFQYAEVGVQHIVPFITKLSALLSKTVANIVSPQTLSKYQITATLSNNLAPRNNSINSITDNDLSSSVSLASNPYSGNQKDSILKDAFIEFNLAKPGPVGIIDFLQGENDKINHAILEYSTNNKDFHEIATFNPMPVHLQHNAKINKKVTAIRIRNLTQTNKWWQIKECNIFQCDPFMGFMFYSNTNKEINISTTISRAEISPTNDITLKPKQFIGIRLDRIKDIKNIEIEASISTLTLQTSTNAIEWDTIKNKNYQKARYIRLINNSPNPLRFNLNKFIVNSNEIEPISILNSYTQIHQNADTALAFDANFNSAITFAAPMQQNSEIVFDLGQTVDINNLKLVVLDTEIDHIRDAKIQISIDAKNFKDVIEIKRKTDDPNAKPQDNNYIHGSLSKNIVPISHSYVEADKINSKARYIRIVATKAYPNRWVKISEIMINNHQYIKKINNPTFISNPIEMQNFSPENMIDGNLSSAYRPDTKNNRIKNGYFSYLISANTQFKNLTIIQDGNTISNARVLARIGKNKFVTIGQLNKSLNKFNTAKYPHIFEIKVEWRNTAPTIYEIITN